MGLLFYLSYLKISLLPFMRTNIIAIEVLFVVLPGWQLVNVNNYENNTSSWEKKKKKAEKGAGLAQKKQSKNGNNLFLFGVCCCKFLPISRCRWCCCWCCCVNKLRSFQLCALIAIRHDAFSNTAKAAKMKEKAARIAHTPCVHCAADVLNENSKCCKHFRGTQSRHRLEHKTHLIRIFVGFFCCFITNSVRFSML